MLDTLILSILLFSGVLAPAFYFYAWWHWRRIGGVVLQWRKPQMVGITIFTFILCLTLFVLACFFWAIHFGRIQQLQFDNLGPSVMLEAGAACVASIGGLVLVYMGLRLFLTQYITQNGILLSQMSWWRLYPKRKLLAWGDIRDYYLHSDYPLTTFSFLVQAPSGEVYRERIRVPFYILNAFESQLHNLHDRHSELRVTGSKGSQRKFTFN